MKHLTTAKKYLAVPFLLALASPVFAADTGFDVSALTSLLALVLAAVALLGTTVLTIYATVAGYKMVRRAF